MTKDTARHDAIVIVAFGIILRVSLILAFPVAFGNDCIGRIYFKDSIFLAHWLPLTQSLVFATAKIGDGILPIRLTFAIIGALAGGAYYAFLRQFTGLTWAVLGGLLFTTNSLYVSLSLMPYQDVLFLGLFYTALACLFRKRPFFVSGAGAVFFGLACLTRYESWFILPILIVWKVVQHENSERPHLVKRLAGAAVYFGWAPITWLLASHFVLGGWNEFLLQTQDKQFYVRNSHLDLVWAGQYALRNLYWYLRFASPIILFAVPGLVAVARNAKTSHPALKLLIAHGAMVIIFFFFIIGKEFEHVNRFVMLHMSIALTFAMVGLEVVANWMSRRGKEYTALARTGAVLAVSAMTAVAVLTILKLDQNPEFRTPYAVAQFIDRSLNDDYTNALVVAPRFADISDAAPMAYQRIIAQSRLGRKRILCAGLQDISDEAGMLAFLNERRIRFLAVFHGFEPALPSDRLVFGLLTRFPDMFNITFETELARIYSVTMAGNQ